MGETALSGSQLTLSLSPLLDAVGYRLTHYGSDRKHYRVDAASQ